MRSLLRFAIATVLALGDWAAPPRAGAANQDTTADSFFGQPDFTHNSANNGGLHATSLSGAAGAALDLQGNLYLADTVNNRVLEYDAPLTAGAAANRVFGQSDFTHSAINNGGLSATSLFAPQGLAFDAADNLYLADAGNNRVLEYDWALFKVELPLIRR